ncbi:hypothetical protein [Bacillus massilinigeriensis]|uniref:hypothetical protein n=1 Tax=Bacillus mediterraneensis TaxID=1805474 RepID=UPI0008F7E64E|nr:hypothetical protein [Bacillus mediterraneensis]
MNPKLKELVSGACERFGLDDYRLGRHSVRRNINSLEETVYLFSMEWFPRAVESWEGEDENPDGTVCIEMNMNSGKLVSLHLPEGHTVRKASQFPCNTNADIIGWLERETGLVYEEQFMLQREEEGELDFTGCFKGIASDGYMSVSFVEEGLRSFSIGGNFPSKQTVREENFDLTLKKMEALAQEQLKLIQFPLTEKKKVVPFYAVEEIYVKNDGYATLPFNVVEKTGANVKLDKTLYWESPLQQEFERQSLSLGMEATIEQALSIEPHPDLLPITKEEEELCAERVTDFLRKVFPADSGKWMLRTLERKYGYLLAALRSAQPDNMIFQKKLGVFLDRDTKEVVNYMDNSFMFEEYEHYESEGPAILSREEAYALLKKHITVTPRYLYDREESCHVLCGLLDSQYAVHASSGEVLPLADL